MSRRPSAPCASRLRLRVPHRSPAARASGPAPRRGRCLPARPRFLRRQGPGVRDRRPGDRRDPDADRSDRDEVPFPARSRPLRSAGSGNRAAVRGLFRIERPGVPSRPGGGRRLRRVVGHRQTRFPGPGGLPAAAPRASGSVAAAPPPGPSGPRRAGGSVFRPDPGSSGVGAPGFEAAGPGDRGDPDADQLDRDEVRFPARSRPLRSAGSGNRAAVRGLFRIERPGGPSRPGGGRRLRRVVGTSAAPGFQGPEAFRPLRLAPTPPGRSP